MAKKLAMMLGVIFLLLGVLGFIPNPLVGESGLFRTDLMHSLVHLISGTLFVYVSMKTSHVVGTTMKVFGVIYLLIAVLGFLAVGPDMVEANLLGLVAVNTADNWLHLVLGVVILLAGFSGKGSGSNMSQPMT